MDQTLLIEVITLISAYILGSIPVGLLISRLFKLPDPRGVGSETIGATNVLRLGNKYAASLTLLLDALKGSLAVIVTMIIVEPLAGPAAILAVIGHVWPVWIGLKGGKGVATAFGAILILSPSLAIVCGVAWLAMAFTTRYSSLSSLTAAVLSPLFTFLLNDEYVITCSVIAGLILWTHRSNITRLITGREPQIGEITPSEIPED
jgi:glycerol-3-phosphate acyltransferase PlsY